MNTQVRRVILLFLSVSGIRLPVRAACKQGRKTISLATIHSSLHEQNATRYPVCSTCLCSTYRLHSTNTTTTRVPGFCIKNETIYRYTCTRSRLRISIWARPFLTTLCVTICLWRVCIVSWVALHWLMYVWLPQPPTWNHLGEEGTMKRSYLVISSFQRLVETIVNSLPQKLRPDSHWDAESCRCIRPFVFS